MAYKDTKNVNAHIRIRNGELLIDEISDGNKPVELLTEISKILLLRDTLENFLRTYEADPKHRI
jgi:hypothetical protein